MEWLILNVQIIQHHLKHLLIFNSLRIENVCKNVLLGVGCSTKVNVVASRKFFDNPDKSTSTYEIRNEMTLICFDHSRAIF